MHRGGSTTELSAQAHCKVTGCTIYRQTQDLNSRTGHKHMFVFTQIPIQSKCTHS